MTNYKQSDPRWANKMIGKTNYSIGEYGCVITDLAMMIGTPPDITNDLLTNAGAINNQGEVIWSKAATALNLRYNNNTSLPVYQPCIGMTDFYTKDGFPQHYFIVEESLNIIDPLDGIVKPIGTYNIISYRNISPQLDQSQTKGDQMTEAQFQEIVWNVVNGFYLTYYKRQASAQELNEHVTHIMATQPQKYSISSWINEQIQEPEFIQKDSSAGLQDQINKIKAIIG